MSDCSKHKKEVCGITDMKELAELIGDLHYESLSDLFRYLSVKILEDGTIDSRSGKEQLGDALYDAHVHISDAQERIYDAWQISKPFMLPNEPEHRSE